MYSQSANKYALSSFYFYPSPDNFIQFADTNSLTEILIHDGTIIAGNNKTSVRLNSDDSTAITMVGKVIALSNSSSAPSNKVLIKRWIKIVVKNDTLKIPCYQ